MKDKKNTVFDYKDTAGYRLMQHEEYLKKMLNKGRRDRDNGNTDNIPEHKD